MAEPSVKRWTNDDLLALPECDDHGWRLRYEIVDGELFVSTSPRWEHQFACAESTGELTLWNRRTGLGLVLVAPGLIFSRHDGVAPDLVWVSHDRFSAAVRDDGHLWGPPELVVEVLSPGAANERRDRQVKLGLYSRMGVDEYWLLDWRVRQVQVYCRQGEKLVLAATLGPSDTLDSPVLPGFAVEVSRLFPSR